MFGSLAKKIFGSVNDRRLKSYRPKVAAINAMEAELEALSDEQLRARTEEFKAQLAAGKTLDDILVPAFATVREASKRTLGQRHFDVQLIGGMVLHEGRISEMKTEEGMERMEQWLREANQLKSDSLYDVENVSVVHHINQGLRAHKLFQRDKDYIVRNGEVVIIDEFTGRMMPGRRYSEGL